MVDGYKTPLTMRSGVSAGGISSRIRPTLTLGCDPGVWLPCNAKG